MPNLIDYKGTQVISPDPSGPGGLALNTNFKELADRVGPAFITTSNPTVNDDSAGTAGNGDFYVWSAWINSSSGDLFICRVQTPTAAVWEQYITSSSVDAAIAAAIAAIPGFAQEVAIALTPGATVATDATLANTFEFTTALDFTLSNPTGAVNRQKLLWAIKQDVVGSRLITLGSKFRFGTDIASVTLTTDPSKTDYLAAVYDSAADMFDVVSLVQGF